MLSVFLVHNRPAEMANDGNQKQSVAEKLLQLDMFSSSPSEPSHKGLFGTALAIALFLAYIIKSVSLLNLNNTMSSHTDLLWTTMTGPDGSNKCMATG